MSQSYREKLKSRVIRNDSGEESYLEFNARCIRKFGPAAGTFLRQLVYWTGKEHDPEGWIYKTQSEMEDETGLSRTQQEKARKILRKAGVLEEVKKGIPCRLHYRVDLEALLGVMETPHSTMNQWRRKRDRSDDPEQPNDQDSSSLDHITEQSGEDGSTFPAGEDDITPPTRIDPNSAPSSENHTDDQAITESTSETTAGISTDNYSSENPLFQSAKAHASRRLSPNKGTEITITPKSSIGPLEISRVYRLLATPGSAAYRAYVLHREGRLSLQDLASEVCLALTSSRNQIESYVEPLREIVADLAIDDAASD
jgi:hypothetical protein